MQIRWMGLPLLLMAGAVETVSAQPFEATVNVGVSRLRGDTSLGAFANQEGGTTDLSLRNNGFRFGFRATLNTYRFFGHEFGYHYSRTALLVRTGGTTQELGTAVHQPFYNFLAYATPEGTRVRPFAAGGAHFSTYPFPGSSVTQGSGSVKVGYNYGAGIKFVIREPYMIRLDYREYNNGKPEFLQGLEPSGRLKQREFTVGFGIAI